MSRPPRPRCCLSTPRCSRCPLRRIDVPSTSLVEEVLRGRRPRELPPSVREALLAMDRLRAAGANAPR